MRWHLTLQAWTRDGGTTRRHVEFSGSVEDAQLRVDSEAQRLFMDLEATGAWVEQVVPRLECETPLFGWLREEGDEEE